MALKNALNRRYDWNRKCILIGTSPKVYNSQIADCDKFICYKKKCEWINLPHFAWIG